MNNWNGIGRLTKDPSIKYISETQTCVANFTVAIDDGYGEKKRTNFIPITVFGRQAENCERFLVKGRLVAIQGKLQTGSYTNKDGQTIYTTDVVADRVEFLEWGEKTGQNVNAGATQGVPSGFQAIRDDDIPF